MQIWHSVHLCEVLAESHSSGPYLLYDGQQVMAEVKAAGGFIHRVQIVEYDGRQYELKATSFFKRGFAIWEGEQEIEYR
jgi:hypothetical protein